MRPTQANPAAAVEVIPLLRSIAREVVERSFAILKLESESQALAAKTVPVQPGAGSLVARLALQKRELRRSVEELRTLGWERDPEQPLRFRARGLRGEEAYTWRPEDSFFYRSAQIG